MKHRRIVVGFLFLFSLSCNSNDSIGGIEHHWIDGHIARVGSCSKFGKCGVMFKTVYGGFYGVMEYPVVGAKVMCNYMPHSGMYVCKPNQVLKKQRD